MAELIEQNDKQEAELRDLKEMISMKDEDLANLRGQVVTIHRISEVLEEKLKLVVTVKVTYCIKEREIL